MVRARNSFPALWRRCAQACLLLIGLAAGDSRAADAIIVAPFNPTNAYEGVLHPKYEVGYWIWTDQMLDQQTCRFWKRFEIPSPAAVTFARIRVAADNSYQLFLDGREIGKGGEWRSLNEYEITQVLQPGTHVLAVETFSDYAAAGFVFGLRVEQVGGQVMELGSDGSWYVVPNDEKNWEKRRQPAAGWKAAKPVSRFLDGHWKQTGVKIFQCLPVQPVIVKFWQTGWFQVTILSICGVAILLCVHLMGRLALHSKTQQFLQRERARIARDIHDDVGARLTQLVLLGERAQRDLPVDAKARTQFDQISERTRDVLGAIDEVVWTVNSRRDTVQDFETYVSTYATGYLQSAGIRCRLDVDADIPEGAFDLAIRRNLFLAIKEALNNAVKYSGATELTLRIHTQDHEMRVAVEDNGRGFAPEHVGQQRNGLSNMAQRIAEVGGKCVIFSALGQGCRIEFLTPLVHSRRPFARWWRRKSAPPITAAKPSASTVVIRKPVSP